MAVDYDLVVWGDTLAGRWAATTATRLQARVALVVPPGPPIPPVASHLVLRELGDRSRQAQFLAGIRDESLPSAPQELMDVQRARQWIDITTETLAEQSSPPLLASAGIDRVVGRAQFQTQPQLQVQVEDRCLRSRAYLLAVEPAPDPPQIPGMEPGSYLRGDRLLAQLQEQRTNWPDPVVVLGAGPTAVELSQVLARLGVQVTLIAQHNGILPQEDPEAAFLVQAHLEAEGITVLTHTPIRAVTLQPDGTPQVMTPNQSLNPQALVWAEDPLSRTLPAQIQALALKRTPQGLWVNRKLQTSHPRIYACGSLLGGYALPHVAQYEATLALNNALFWPRLTVDYRPIPWAIFTDPELARVGLTEPQARHRYRRVHVLRQYYKTVAKAHLQGETTGFCKLLTNAKGHILGAHLVGAGAADLVHLIAFAIKHGCPVSSLRELVYISPTLAEITFQTAGEWQRTQQNRFRKDLLASFFRFRRS